jgi:hypothetical protein
MTLTAPLSAVRVLQSGKFKCGSPPTCSAASCAASDVVSAVPAAPVAPTIRLRLPPSTPFLPVDPAANRTYYLPYGEPAPFSLLPCPSGGTPLSAGCAAVAADPVDGDLTASISFSDTSPCNASNACSQCSATSVSTGHCPPGIYLFQWVDQWSTNASMR